MPGKEDFELLREIRSLDPSDGGKAPVIAITGLSRPRDQMRRLCKLLEATRSSPSESSAISRKVSFRDHQTINGIRAQNWLKAKKVG
jgi:CheY-like chemotaxis protein